MHLSLHYKLKMKSAISLHNYLLKNIFIFVYMISAMLKGCNGNPQTKKLYDDLFSNYNEFIQPAIGDTDTLTELIRPALNNTDALMGLIMPVLNNTSTLMVKLGQQLSHLIETLDDINNEIDEIYGYYYYAKVIAYMCCASCGTLCLLFCLGSIYLGCQLKKLINKDKDSNEESILEMKSMKEKTKKLND